MTIKHKLVISILAGLLSAPAGAEILTNLADLPTKGQITGTVGLMNSKMDMKAETVVTPSGGIDFGDDVVYESGITIDDSFDRGTEIIASGMFGFSQNFGISAGISSKRQLAIGGYGRLNLLENLDMLIFTQYKLDKSKFSDDDIPDGVNIKDIDGKELSAGAVALFKPISDLILYAGPQFIISSEQKSGFDVPLRDGSTGSIVFDAERKDKFGLILGFSKPLRDILSIFGTASVINEQTFMVGVSKSF